MCVSLYLIFFKHGAAERCSAGSFSETSARPTPPGRCRWPGKAGGGRAGRSQRGAGRAPPGTGGGGAARTPRRAAARAARRGGESGNARPGSGGTDREAGPAPAPGSWGGLQLRGGGRCWREGGCGGGCSHLAKPPRPSRFRARCDARRGVRCRRSALPGASGLALLLICKTRSSGILKWSSWRDFSKTRDFS